MRNKHETLGVARRVSGGSEIPRWYAPDTIPLGIAWSLGHTYRRGSAPESPHGRKHRLEPLSRDQTLSVVSSSSWMNVESNGTDTNAPEMYVHRPTTSEGRWIVSLHIGSGVGRLLKIAGCLTVSVAGVPKSKKLAGRELTAHYDCGKSSSYQRQFPRSWQVRKAERWTY